jgi:acyl carrier protein
MQRSMTLPEFCSEFETVALEPPGSVTGSEELASFDGWDSLAIVEFMSMTHEKLGIQIEPRQLAACVRVSDLAALCGIAQ